MPYHGSFAGRDTGSLARGVRSTAAAAALLTSDSLAGNGVA